MVKIHYIKVEFWIGLVMRAKQISIHQNPQDKNWFVEIIDMEELNEDKKTMVVAIEEIRNIELVK